MVFLTIALISLQIILVLFFIYEKYRKNTKNDNIKSEFDLTKFNILETSLNESNKENKLLNEKIVSLEIERANLINEAKSLKKYEEINKTLEAKNDNLVQIIKQKDEELNKLRLEKSEFENLYNIEKSSHANIEVQMNKYIVDLLEKNKEIIDKNFEEKNKINSQNLSEMINGLADNFNKITEKVSNIENKSNFTEKIVSDLKNSLIVPYKAGHTSEITLENILKNSGLRKKNSLLEDGDYIMQTSLKANEDMFNENILRPDAIIYLPNNNYIIIDSKTSSQFIELQEAIDNNDNIKIKELMQKLKERLNKHLNDLISKDYKKALYNFLSKDSNIEPTIMTIMFVQTEKIMSLIREIDPGLEIKALQFNIPIASPLGLINLLNIGKYTIQKELQDKNIDKLKQEVFSLIDNISTIFERTEKVGKKLYEAIGNYNDLTTTYNTNLLARVKNIHKLGIKGKKDLPNKLSRFDLQKDIIDGELMDISNKLLNEE